MRLLAVFRKSLREQCRDYMTLSLTLVCAPFFVFLYWLWFPSGSTSYRVLVLNNDNPVQWVDGSTLAGGGGVIEAVQSMTYASGNPLLRVSTIVDREEAERQLRDRDATVLLIIPPDFSETLFQACEGRDGSTTSVTFVGDLTNPYYSVAGVMVNAVLDEYIQVVTGQERAIQIAEEPLGESGARSEFEVYVPGLLVFATVMLVFQASMVIASEVEAGTLRRLQLTRMTAFDFLGGVSASIVLIGVVAVLLTFVAALAMGFHSQGPVWVALLVGAVTSIAIVGSGLVVACFSKTVSQAFIIANFPLILFMFFSGAIFPMPSVALFTIGRHDIGLYDILPPTHAVNALNKVLTLGAGLEDVGFELFALLVLSVLYFTVGVWLFSRTQLRAK